MTGRNFTTYITLNSDGRPVATTRGRYKIVANTGDEAVEIGHVDLIGGFAVNTLAEVKTNFRNFVVGHQFLPSFIWPAVYIADSSGEYSERLTELLLGAAGSNVDVRSIDARSTGGLIAHPRSA